MNGDKKGRMEINLDYKDIRGKALKTLLDFCFEQCDEIRLFKGITAV